MKSTKILSLILLCTLLLCGCGIRRVGSADSSGLPSSTAPTDVQTESPDQTGAQTDAQSAQSDADSKAPPVTDAPTDVPSADAPPTDAPPTDAPPSDAPKGDYTPLVFMYHLILEQPYSAYEGLFVRPSEFKAHLEVLNSLGYRFAFAEEYVENAEYPTAILTFDDGYEDNYTEMFPLLKAANAKATVFVATSLVGAPGYLTEAQIKEMAASGLVSIQSHTAAHLELKSQSAEYIKREMENSIAYLEGLTGRDVRAMAYPVGRFDEATMAEVGKYVDFAYTTQAPSAATVKSPLAIPRVRINRGCSASAFRSICAY